MNIENSTNLIISKPTKLNGPFGAMTASTVFTCFLNVTGNEKGNFPPTKI